MQLLIGVPTPTQRAEILAIHSKSLLLTRASDMESAVAVS